jgi:protein-tyrosine phosphatase
VTASSPTGSQRGSQGGSGPGAVRVSFVCLGNICRSPTAEAVMRHLVREAGLEDRISIESAGTGDWHVGEPRDRRSVELSRRRGMPLSGTARQFQRSDFDRLDYVVVMDRQNLAALERLVPDAAERAKMRAKIHLLRAFEPEADPDDAEVPDPYHGEADGFDRVIDICLQACRGLLQHLRREHGL